LAERPAEALITPPAGRRTVEAVAT